MGRGGFGREAMIEAKVHAAVISLAESWGVEHEDRHVCVRTGQLWRFHV